MASSAPAFVHTQCHLTPLASSSFAFRSHDSMALVLDVPLCKPTDYYLSAFVQFSVCVCMCVYFAPKEGNSKGKGQSTSWFDILVTMTAPLTSPCSHCTHSQSLSPPTPTFPPPFSLWEEVKTGGSAYISHVLTKGRGSANFMTLAVLHAIILQYSFHHSLFFSPLPSVTFIYHQSRKSLAFSLPWSSSKL